MEPCLDLEPLNHPTVLQVLADNFIDILFIDVGIPNLFRIDDCHRALLTAAQATGKVNPDPTLAGQAQLLRALLGIVTHRPGTEVCATGFTARPLVGTEKHVVFVIAHKMQRKGTGYRV